MPPGWLMTPAGPSGVCLFRMGAGDQGQDGEKVLLSLAFTRVSGPETVVSIVT